MMDGPVMTLLPVTQALKAAFARSRAAFEFTVGLPLPADWPQFPEAFAPDAQGGSDNRWGGYLFVSDKRIVGNGGFAGPPDPSGTVEIGYEVAPAEWNRGFATVAARCLLNLAFAADAREVVAHSAPEWNASNRVMTKVGMTFIAAIPNAELGSVWRFAIARDQFADR